jgi:hypothetical protein
MSACPAEWEHIIIAKPSIEKVVASTVTLNHLSKNRDCESNR